MILAMGLPPSRLTAIWALRMARVWIFTKSGIIRPRRQPRRPSIGFCSCIDLMAASSSPVLGRGGVAGQRDLDQLLLEVGQELVQRRVDEADDHGQAVHGLEDALEVALLEDLQLGHRGVELADGMAVVGVERLAGSQPRLGPRGDVGDEDGAAHDLQPLALAEHVLGAAEADALGAVGARQGGLLGLVGVGPDAHAPDVVGPVQDLLQLGLVLEAGR